MANSQSALKQPKKSSSVRHTRAIQRDRSKRPLVAPPDEQVSQRLTDLVHPATLSQVAYFHDLGLRERVFTLPLMVAIVLSMIWRQIGEVTQVVRLMQKVCSGHNRNGSRNKPCRNGSAPCPPPCF